MSRRVLCLQQSDRSCLLAKCCILGKRPVLAEVV